MIDFLQALSAVFVALFPVVNPIGCAPIFLTIARRYPDSAQRILSGKIAIYSFVLLAASFLFGSIISVVRNPRKPTFNVTAKGEAITQDRMSELALPYFVIFGVLAATLGAAAYRYNSSPEISGLLLIVASRRPDVFRLQRSAGIRASPEKIFGLINDIRQFNTWNPYNRKDPGMKGTYSGPDTGPGALFTFDGNKNAGKGSIGITESAAPSKVGMKLDMTAPFACSNDIAFTLVPRGEMTEVTWAMEGPQPFMGKVMGIFFNMDKMVGKDFEAGLASLKEIAEKP